MAEVAVATYTPVVIASEPLPPSPTFARPPIRIHEKDPVQSHNDPHQLPSFSGDVTSTPILYLPPLLSSLPRGYAHAALPRASHATRPITLSTSSRLPSIDRASLALHRALHHFQPITPNYATVPYAEAFNWSELELALPLEDEREWYCVVFRSKRRAESDAGRESLDSFRNLRLTHLSPHVALYEADKKAHEEAVQNGGVSRG